MFWVKVREHWNTHRIRQSRFDTIPGRPVVSFAGVFRDVTQRSPEKGMLRDILKDGCEGDYLCPGKCYLAGYLLGICNPALCVLNKVESRVRTRIRTAQIFYAPQDFISVCGHMSVVCKI